MYENDMSLYSTRRLPRCASLDAYPAGLCSRVSHHTAYSHPAPCAHLAKHDSEFVAFAYGCVRQQGAAF